MNIHKIPEAYDFTKRIVDAVEGKSYGNNLKAQLSRLLWHQVIQDALAIIYLCDYDCVGSARALARPQLEALCRSAWVSVLATDKQLSKYAEGKYEPPRISKLVEMLSAEQTGWVVLGNRIPFEQVWLDKGKAFHDTAHRGTRALARLASGNKVVRGEFESDEIALFHLATTCAGAAGAAFLEDINMTQDSSEVWRELQILNGQLSRRLEALEMKPKSPKRD